MPPDPNARLLKAVEDLTRAVSENNKLLKKVLDRGRRLTFTNHPYLEGSDSEDTATGGESTTEYEGPYGSGGIVPR